MRIPLPKVSRSTDAIAHGYPVQIAFQTQEFMQATIFHHAFMDTAAGQRVREPGGFLAVEKELLDNGLDLETNNQAWALISKYQDIFEQFVFQNVLILLRSHWDWYIENLGAFVVHARAELGGPRLSKKECRDLEQIGFASIRNQISLLSVSTGINLSLAPEIVDKVEEMSLVRNLGIHNRWEVNSFYLSKSKHSGEWELGEIRTFCASELEGWHKSLVELVHQTCFAVAKLYSAASGFPN
jgi:hypothetical protein